MLSETTTAHFRPQKILVPIDFSPSSNSALEVARDLAQHFSAELIILTVVPMFSADKVSDEFIPTFSPDSVRVDDLKQLSEFASMLVSQGIKAIARTEVGEDVAGNIMLTIRKEQVDLLIISSHGKSGWRETVFGSIADCVVKQVECPMLLLRSAKPGVKTDQDHDNANGALLVGSSR